MHAAASLLNVKLIIHLPMTETANKRNRFTNMRNRNNIKGIKTTGSIQLSEALV
jgi:hypothetical protein